MNDARTTPEIDSPRPRAERQAAGLVARYIHELSQRNGGARGGSRGPAAASGAEPETDRIAGPEGG